MSHRPVVRWFTPIRRLAPRLGLRVQLPRVAAHGLAQRVLDVPPALSGSHDHAEHPSPAPDVPPPAPARGVFRRTPPPAAACPARPAPPAAPAPRPRRRPAA